MPLFKVFILLLTLQMCYSKNRDYHNNYAHHNPRNKNRISLFIHKHKSADGVAHFL